MTDFFYDIYLLIRDKNHFLSKIRFYSFLRLLIRSCANILLPIYYKITSNNEEYKIKSAYNGVPRLIVSMTSFPARISKVWIVIETILRQKHKPDVIFLWLSKEQFPTIESVPQNLQKLCRRGLKIVLEDGDLRSHKKYYYAMKKFPNDIIVTIDDDIIYKSDFLNTLYQSYTNTPKAVHCRYAHEILYDEKARLLPYVKWIENKQKSLKNKNLFFGSGGGTLFPPQVLYKDVLKIDLALKLCGTADDIWLNTMCRLNHTDIVLIDTDHLIFPIMNLWDSKLASINIENQNDIQIKSIVNYYQLKLGINPFTQLY